MRFITAGARDLKYDGSVCRLLDMRPKHSRLCLRRWVYKTREFYNGLPPTWRELKLFWHQGKLTGNEIKALPVLGTGLDLAGEQVEFDRLPVGLWRVKRFEGQYQNTQQSRKVFLCRLVSLLFETIAAIPIHGMVLFT